jgi:DNA ligase (NAD+)
MSDEEYDRLEEELRQLAPESSVFNITGSDFIPDGEKTAVGQRMFSTDKALTEDELRSFWNRTAGAKEYVLTTKIDGLSVNLVYDDGILITATTRGDGYTGRAFTSKVPHIKCIPTKLTEKFTGKVRGEVYLTDEAFEKLNGILADGEEELQSNSRNSTSGLINSQDLKNPERKLPLLKFRAFGVYDDADEGDDWGSYENYTDQLAKATALGFNAVEAKTFARPSDFIPADHKDWIDNFEAACDGVVLRVNNQAFARNLGTGKNYINGATAFKYKPEIVLAKVIDIKWQVGSKSITPVVIIEETELDGARINNVGGHSVKNLIACDAVPGRTIALVRSGGVIPRMYHRTFIDQ